MNKKSLAALLAVFVLAGSLGTVCLGATTETEASSDGDVASSGDTGITIGLPQDLDSSLDPYQITAAGTREVMFNVFEGVTADDVLYSFKTCADTTVNSSVASALSDIAGEKADGNTVTITLKEPLSSFLSAVSSVSIVPADYTDQASAPVGTQVCFPLGAGQCRV